MLRNLEYYQNIAVAELEKNEQRNKFYDKVDVAIKGGQPLPDALRKLPWMVHYKSNSLNDAYSAARRTLKASKLTVSVTPPIGSEETAKRAEIIERVLEYNFKISNKRGAKGPMAKIIEGALKYMVVAYQVVDVEEEYKGRKGPKIEAIKRAGRFSNRYHDPRNVHARWSEDILDSVLIAQLNTGQELVDKYGEDNKAIKKLMRDMKSDKDMDGVDLMTTKFGHFVYMDYEDKVIWIEGRDKLTPGSDSPYEIMREPHGLGFLPFVYREGDDSLLKSAIETNQLENLNIMLSMRYALIAATVSQARTWSRTPSGGGVFIDHSSPGAQIQMRIGEDAGVFPPSQTDPHLSEIIADGESRIANTTSVSRMLSSMDTLAANTPFSTINAMMQAAISSLFEFRELCENAISDGFYQNLHWIKKNNRSLTGRRTKRIGLYDETMNVGAVLSIGSESFDYDWLVEATLTPNSPTDRQERMTYAINTKSEFNLSRAWAIEHAGIDVDPQVQFDLWADDEIAIAEVEAEKIRILQAPELEAQQAQQEQLQQQEQQQQQQEQQGVRNPAQIPNAQFDPTATRERVSGNTVAGGETAGG